MLKKLFALIVLTISINCYADNLSDSNNLFDWAEQNYPQLFSPAGQATFEINGYLARFYPETNNYLGTQGNDVYVLGDEFGGLLKVGVISDFIEVQLPEEQVLIQKMIGTWDFIIPDFDFTSNYTFFPPEKLTDRGWGIQGSTENKTVTLYYNAERKIYQLVDGFDLWEFTLTDNDNVRGEYYWIPYVADFTGIRK